MIRDFDFPIVSFDLLSDLWDRFAHLGLPIASSASAGLSEERLLAMAEAEGLRLPPEPMTWWRWRNGTPAGNCHGDGFPGRTICPEYELIPFDEALDLRRLKRHVAETTATPEIPADYGYPASWLPVIRWSEASIVCDCSSVGPGTPLHHTSFSSVDFDIALVPVAPSIGRMVEMWIRAMDAGLWRYDPEQDTIESNRDAMPPQWRTTSFM